MWNARSSASCAHATSTCRRRQGRSRPAGRCRSRGGCGPVIANGPVTIRQGGCGPLIANGDVSIEQGGSQSVIAAGGATLGDRSFVGLVLSPKVTVEDGAKILMNTPQALAFGATLGVLVGLAVRLFRRGATSRSPRLLREHRQHRDGDPRLLL